MQPKSPITAAARRPLPQGLQGAWARLQEKQEELQNSFISLSLDQVKTSKLAQCGQLVAYLGAVNCLLRRLAVLSAGAAWLADSGSHGPLRPCPSLEVDG
jgi:hypothetical protein